MKEYEFELKYALQDTKVDLDECAGALYSNGCDDALIGTGQAGKIAIRFNREAENAFEAVKSAMLDVKKCLPEARLIESNPDLVGLSDIAGFLGCTRQNVRKLMLNHFAEFPDPLHDGSTQIWRLAEVLNWVRTSRNDAPIEDSLWEVAEANMHFNIALHEPQGVDSKLTEQHKALARQAVA